MGTTELFQEFELPVDEVGTVLRRVRNGLAHRFAVARGDDLNAMPQQPPSVFGALEARRRPEAIQIFPYEGDDRWVFVLLSLSAPSIAVQCDIVRSISQVPDVDFNTLYAVGAIASGKTLSWDALSTVPDTDLSILVETLLNADRLPGGIRLLLEPEFAQFTRALTPRKRQRFRGFEEIGYRLSSVCDPDPVTSLADLNRYVASLRSTWLHILGPDLPASLQLLLDPAEDPTLEMLHLMRTVFDRWSLKHTFGALLLLRSLGGYEASLGYLSDHRGELLDNNPIFSGSHSFAALLGTESIGGIEQPRVGGYFAATATYFAGFKRALQNRDAWSVFATVADIYSLDQGLVAFLPWDAIYDLYAESPEITAHTAFVSMLMSEDTVGQRYPEVFFSAGKGAFIADLTSLIEPDRRSGATSALLARIRRLPASTAAALTRALLQRPIMERLASSLPKARRWSDGRQPTEIDAISALRIDTLRMAGSRGLISHDYMEQQIVREIEHVTLLYLQGRMRVGRVRMPWPDIGRDLQRQLESLPLSTLRKSADTDELRRIPITRLAEYIAHQVCGHLLYDSEFAIDQALSNNLRHGVVLPRYLRAFEDAFQACLPHRTLSGWETGHLARWFDGDAEALAALRDGVADLIGGFIGVHLTVEKDRGFERELVSAVASLVRAWISSSDGERRLEKQILRVTKQRLDKALASASRHIHEQIRPQLTRMVAELRRANGEGRHLTNNFLDSLEANLEEANEEVRSWLHIADKRGAAIPFHLQQVVKLHLFSTSLYASDKLKIICNVERDGHRLTGTEGAISGKYFDFFEDLVGNLLSNAMAHSGDRLKTRATLTLNVAEGQLRIRCENEINPRKLPELMQTHARTQALAQQPLGRNVNKDNLSGFQKIRAAYRKALKAQPLINVPSISSKVRRFVIEIRCDRPEDLFA